MAIPFTPKELTIPLPTIRAAIATWIVYVMAMSLLFATRWIISARDDGYFTWPMRRINVLIACEESQAEMLAFRSRGFNAYSCDIQKPRRGADLRYQIQGDVTPFLHGSVQFTTMDGKRHKLAQWHLIVCHPPCTYLCKVGSVHLYAEGHIVWERLAQMIRARRFFMECLNAKAPYVAVENPLPMRRANLPKPDCFVQPFWYGHPYSKKTLYWLRNLPPLMPDAEVANFKEFVRSSRGKYRSRTFEGIANAMAVQWGDFILDELQQRT